MMVMMMMMMMMMPATNIVQEFESTSQVKHRFLQPTVITYNSCITCCGAAGRWLKAAELFGSLMPRSLRPSMISRCSLLTACEKVRGWPQALSSFDDFGAGGPRV